MNQKRYTSFSSRPILAISFFRTLGGREPVREWLQGLPESDRRLIGNEIRLLQFGWPLGMPLVRKLEPNLWEIRVRTGSGNARLLISLAEDTAILLHAFMKKSQKTPLQDLQLARTRRSWLTGG